MSESSSPAYRIYSAIPRRDNGEDWLSIGVAVPHQDGKGFDVTLQALPLNPKLVLRDCMQGLRQMGRSRAPDRHRKPGRPPSLKQQVDAFERALIEQCLLETGGRISAVMERLDIPRRTLSEKMTRLRIDRQQLISGARTRASDERSAAIAPGSSLDEAFVRNTSPQPAD